MSFPDALPNLPLVYGVVDSARSAGRDYTGELIVRAGAAKMWSGRVVNAAVYGVAARDDRYSASPPPPPVTGGSALHGNVIQRSVRRHTYSLATVDRDFS